MTIRVVDSSTPPAEALPAAVKLPVLPPLRLLTPTAVRDLPFPGPAQAEVPRDKFYSTRLRQLVHLELDEPDAKALWQNVVRHRRTLFKRLGRDVGQRVALLDYIVNMQEALGEPEIVEKTTLQAIEQRAVADPVTGLYNRHYFDEALAREVERCRRYRVPSSLLLLDLDRFKQINDKFGHWVGDHVLGAVGERILRHVRAPDVASRWGGDEFAIILPDTPLPDALIVGERICRDISVWFLQNPVSGSAVPVTVSGGVATLTWEHASVERLFREADAALYLAKAQGGDTVSIPE